MSIDKINNTKLSEEEKKAIEFLREFKPKIFWKEPIKIENQYVMKDDINLKNKIDTVLHLIDRVEKENELQKENYKNLILDVSRIAIELGLEEDGTIDEIYAKIKEKDKQIDLMAEYINYLSDELVKETGKNELAFCNMQKCIDDDNIECEDCIKEYFEKLVKEKGE